MRMRSCLLGLLCLAVIGFGSMPMVQAKQKTATTSVAAPAAPATDLPSTASPSSEVAAPTTDPAPATEQHYAERGSMTCMKCHDQDPVTKDNVQVMDILKTPHALKGDGRTPFGQDNHDCETCHGPSSDHVHSRPAPGEKRSSPAVVFNGPNASPVEKRNEVCLTCHQNGLRMNWQGSQHQNNDIACVSCHTVHAKKDPVLLKQTQPEKCFTCHAEQRAESFMYSHHPIREGKVACADCHNPHGGPGPKLLKEFTINETCYNCHAEKRGPMMFEHEPVREDCTNCHTPHGSTQARLLKERPPFLCMNCHNTGGHNANPFNANNLPNFATNDAALSARLMARGCVNCHSQIHGSNSPAGKSFER